MDSYGIKTEAEILSGSILDLSKPSHRKKDMQPVNNAVMSLRRKARTWFSKGNKSGVCDVYAKASAWYHVTYHHSYRQGMDRDNFLSFPWCICDELVHIKRENASKRALRRSSLQKLIYRLFLWLLFFLCLLLLIFVLINKY
ncbi:RNA-dependent RNA polymerase 1 [Morella rubra]|nr:RNA-dependent RNA polymerase 1 [Morella rubra]